MVTITHEDVQAFLRKVTIEQPDRVNPWSPVKASCLYNAPDGTHCIAGEYLASKGVSVPSDLEGAGIFEVLFHLRGEVEVDPAARGLLRDAQNVADGRDLVHVNQLIDPRPRPWGAVGHILSAAGLI